MRIEQELKMGQRFPSARQELLVSLIVTAERLREYTNRMCQEFGITIQQYNMLRILRGAFPRSLSCAEVNSRMIQRSPDITRLIDRLEHFGYVERARDDEDNRIVRTKILPQGMSLIESMESTISRTYDVFNILEDSEQQLALSLMERIRAELQNHLPVLGQTCDIRKEY